MSNMYLSFFCTSNLLVSMIFLNIYIQGFTMDKAYIQVILSPQVICLILCNLSDHLYKKILKCLLLDYCRIFFIFYNWSSNLDSSVVIFNTFIIPSRIISGCCIPLSLIACITSLRFTSLNSDSWIWSLGIVSLLLKIKSTPLLFGWLVTLIWFHSLHRQHICINGKVNCARRFLGRRGLRWFSVQ